MLPEIHNFIKHLMKELVAAENVCRIYFEIAADAIGEDEVVRRRDEKIKQETGT